jgi:hypothetical protein
MICGCGHGDGNHKNGNGACASCRCLGLVPPALPLEQAVAAVLGDRSESKVRYSGRRCATCGFWPCEHSQEPGGVKQDSAKVPLELIPYDALLEVAKVLDFGAKKYAARNWEQGISVSRVFAACMRHAWALFLGEDDDPETGLSHAAHLACEALFWLAFIVRKTPGVDDRPRTLNSTTNTAKP